LERERLLPIYLGGGEKKERFLASSEAPISKNIESASPVEGEDTLFALRTRLRCESKHSYNTFLISLNPFDFFKKYTLIS